MEIIKKSRREQVEEVRAKKEAEQRRDYEEGQRMKREAQERLEE